MRNKLGLFLLIGAVGFGSCTSTKTVTATHSYSQIPLVQDAVPNSELLANLLQKKMKKFETVLGNRDSMWLQIIFTQIDRDSLQHPHFTHHFYNVSNRYFYPASTVKLPVAVLALERLNNLNLPGVNKHTTMLTDSSYTWQTAVSRDTSAWNGMPSVAQYIRKIFLVSDNEAFNRLYEFLGQEGINTRLQSLGFSAAQLRHRLGIAPTDDENRHANGVQFIDANGKVLLHQYPSESSLRFQPRSQWLGKGYRVASKTNSTADSLISEPMDFSKKNDMPLPYLHTMLQWVMFPNSQPVNRQLNLTDSDYYFLQRYMSMFPAESHSPVYNAEVYGPAYAKFLLAGGQKKGWPNANVRIFNKAGNAFGFLTDVAYIIDSKDGTEFMLSCTLLCNSDGIFNDDKYDYETVGLPFMKKLGEIIYDYERKRAKRYKPDLSNFAFNYTN